MAGKAIARSLIDQYSVACVLGSVMGCVIVPLITQSLESIIISAIVITLTAQTLSRRMLTNPEQPAKEERRRARREDGRLRKKRPASAQSHPSPPPVAREKDDAMIEQEKLAAKERRMEEKREKKARKREERTRRKEREEEERKLEEAQRREARETRAMKKQEQKQRKLTTALSYPLLHDVEYVTSMKPLQRERKPSSSSSCSSSSISTKSHPHSKTKACHHPSRAFSDSSLARPHTSTPHTSTPHSPPRTPSSTRAWQTLPPPVAPAPPQFLHTGTGRLHTASSADSWKQLHDRGNWHQASLSKCVPSHVPVPVPVGCVVPVPVGCVVPVPVGCAVPVPVPVGCVVPVPVGCTVARSLPCRPVAMAALVRPALQQQRQQQFEAWRASVTDFTEKTLFHSYPQLTPVSTPTSLPCGGAAPANCYSLFSEGESPFGTTLLSGQSTPCSPSLSPTSQMSFSCSQETNTGGHAH